jgi:hypothetical protein
MAIRHYCSDGSRVTQPTIESRKGRAYKEDEENASYVCEGCGQKPAEHHDHTISQSMCKSLHKAELIWTPINWAYSCPKCHLEWESYKSGLFSLHNNFELRMNVLKQHDEEGYKKRMLYVQ